ncbi:MAG: 2-oxoacid:acceptor oxidoreductase family protein [Desulfobacteraceae bacterium]|nr:2-oxoacid:acceptor oxidoreductase family protein [Desulfobacteraceae bacterium]
MEKCRFLFSGSGGQGVITAAILLAEAAVRFESLNAVQSQSYGAAARGGAARSDVIIWDKPIYFPGVIQPNVLICLTQEAFDKYQSTIRPGGYLVTDSDLVKNPAFVDARRVELAFQKTVMEKIGKPVVLNICLLGAIVELTGLVRLDSVKELIRKRFSPSFHEINLKALDLGAQLLRNHKKL